MALVTAVKIYPMKSVSINTKSDKIMKLRKLDNNSRFVFQFKKNLV